MNNTAQDYSSVEEGDSSIDRHQNRPRNPESYLKYEDRNKPVLNRVTQKVELMGHDASTILDFYNRKIADLADQIKAVQPVKENSVTLHLSTCGNGCIGCPHPYWYKWFNPSRGADTTQWTSKKLSKPLMEIRRNKQYDSIRPLIKQAVKTIEQRSKLIKAISTLHQSIIRHERNINSSNY